MKLKLLTMLFAIGLFAFGSGVMAGNTDKVLTKAELQAGGADLISTVCDFVGGVAGAPADCKDACKSIAKPDFAKLSCCMAALKNEDLIPDAISSNIGKLSYPLCSGFGCGLHSALIDICGAINCNTGYDDVTNCLKVGGKTCAADFSPDKCSAADKCAKVKCTKGQACDPTTGKCAAPDKCAKVKCPTGQTCDSTTGKCSATDKCAKVKCPTGQTCDSTTGKCAAADKCAKVKCPTGQTCDSTTGKCAADKCSGIKCATGQTCDVLNNACLGKSCTTKADCTIPGQTCRAVRGKSGAKFCCTTPSGGCIPKK
ncbi:MAG: hypothetical protein H0X26_04350 [Alphaproteobacteria bacterium]|nr:hypothetical protein [Alphaproteobacteria bacterium]